MAQGLVLHPLQARRVLARHVAHMPQPVVHQAHPRPGHAGMHATAAVVADDQDVLDLEHIDRELHRREAVEVAVHHHVGHVAVDEHLARVQTQDLVGRHARIGAADPQIARRLLLGQAFEEARIVLADPVGPVQVVAQQVFEIAHARDYRRSLCEDGMELKHQGLVATTLSQTSRNRLVERSLLRCASVGSSGKPQWSKLRSTGGSRHGGDGGFLGKA